MSATAAAIEVETNAGGAMRIQPAQAILAAIVLIEIVVFSVIGTNFLSIANAFEVLRLSVEIHPIGRGTTSEVSGSCLSGYSWSRGSKYMADSPVD